MNKLSAAAVFLAMMMAWGCAIEPELPLTVEGRTVITIPGTAAVPSAPCPGRDYIASTAEYIVEGRITRRESAWNAGKTSIITLTEMRALRYVKGEPLGTNSLIILTAGGTVGENSQVEPGQPTFERGKRMRVYVQKKGGLLQVVCGQWGVEEADVPQR